MIPHAALLATIIPAIVGLLIYIFQKYIRQVSGWIATAAASSSVLLVFTMVGPVIENYNNGISTVYVYRWIDPIDINFGFLIDMVSFPIGMIITIVSAVSCLYSVKYMEKEENQPSYFANLLIFMTGMLGVVFSINLVQFYLFWDDF